MVGFWFGTLGRAFLASALACLVIHQAPGLACFLVTAIIFWRVIVCRIAELLV